jgi:dihydrofolate reductase
MGELMGKLIYAINTSLDGYVETQDHSLDWATVDDEVHSFWNEQQHDLDASLYGRRMYELMSASWPHVPSDPSATPVMLEYARAWADTPKIVFSKSLESVEWNSRLVRGDVADELARLREEFAGDLAVSGPTLAASFIRRGLVDEYRMVVHPVALGSGTPYFPDLERPIGLRLIETRTFQSGAIYLAYAAKTS